MKQRYNPIFILKSLFRINKNNIFQFSDSHYFNLSLIYIHSEVVYLHAIK